MAFFSRFIPNFASVTAPLRKLTHKDQEWAWGEKENEALEKLKHAIGKSKTLGYFYVNQETLVYVDGSPIGLGALLVQKDKAGNLIQYTTQADH